MSTSRDADDAASSPPPLLSEPTVPPADVFRQQVHLPDITLSRTLRLPVPPILQWVEPGDEAAPCSCSCLVDPLVSDAALPDHVCTATMRASVLRWQSEEGRPICTDWPLPHDGRLLMMVIRQQVYEPDGKEWLGPAAVER
jgi:hypothetical protein